MQTSLKTGFAQIFLCCPKTLSCPKFGEAAAPPRPPPSPPARTPMRMIMAKDLKMDKTETCTHLKGKTHPKVNFVMQERMS